MHCRKPSGLLALQISFMQILETAKSDSSWMSHTKDFVDNLQVFVCDYFCSNIKPDWIFYIQALLFQAWLTEINEYAQEDVVIMLLGNKADMASERVIGQEDGEKLAKVNILLPILNLLTVMLGLMYPN